MQWLERFRFELTVIPQRDPFQSAVENIEKYAGDTQYEFSRYQRDLAIVTEYEQEYEQVANVFKNVQTLYQLLQTISQNDYFQDEIVESFTEKAVFINKCYENTVICIAIIYVNMIDWTLSIKNSRKGPYESYFWSAYTKWIFQGTC